MRRLFAGWVRELRLAILVGSIGGVVFGIRDGTATLADNAFADAQHHALAYLLVPVAIWFVLGPALLAALTLPAALMGGATRGFYGGAIVLFGVALTLLPWVERAIDSLHAVGGAPTTAVLVLLVGFVLLLAVGAATMARATVAAYAGKPMIRRASLAVLAIGMVAVVWTVHFLTLNLRPTRAVSEPVTWRVPPRGAPNVVLVSIDTLRADAVGAYGSSHHSTPRLDRLAAEGVTVERAISPAPWTLPALASVMTGLYPRHHGAGGVTNRFDPLARSPLVPGIPTLGSVFADGGYRTNAVVTNPYLLARSGLDAGYHRYENLTFLSEAMLAGSANAGQWLLNRLAPHLVVGDRGSEVSDRAVRWLDQVADDRPFLMWLHYIDPHGPYGGVGKSRHKSFRGELSFDGVTGREGAGAELSPEPARLRSGEVRLGPEGKEEMRSLYRSEVEEVDRQVGRVLDALDRRGLADRTLVVVVSDHGEEFWEHGGVEHGHTLYDEVLHVVWLMRWPDRFRAGTRLTEMVSTVDLVPTVVELAGIEYGREIDGVSLVPALEGEPLMARAVISENLLFAEERVSMRTATAKLVRWASGKEEFYDLRHDPGEQRDLAGDESFAAPLREEFARVDAALEPAIAPVAASSIPASSLRALGYLH